MDGIAKIENYHLPQFTKEEVIHLLLPYVSEMIKR